MDNIEIVCSDCGKKFLFTTAEQTFFLSKGFTPPKRCPLCRRIRKEKKKQAELGSPTQQRI